MCVWSSIRCDSVQVPSVLVLIQWLQVQRIITLPPVFDLYSVEWWTACVRRAWADNLHLDWSWASSSVPSLGRCLIDREQGRRERGGEIIYLTRELLCAYINTHAANIKERKGEKASAREKERKRERGKKTHRRRLTWLTELLLHKDRG